MKLSTLFALGLVGIALPSKAQYFEIGLGAGTAHYMGDLAPHAIQVRQTKLSQTVFVNYHVNRKVAVGLSLNHGKVSGDDKYATEPTTINRNLSFKTGIWEAHLRGEYYLFGFDNVNARKAFSPYVFAGVGGFLFNPYTTYNGAKVYLQPLGTEGQGTPLNNSNKYKLAQICLPFGGGVKYALNQHFIIGVELGFRKLFTDYLDDVSTNYVNLASLASYNGDIAAALSVRADEVSTADVATVMSGIRGNKNFKDWYILSNISVSYVPFTKHNKANNSNITGKLRCFAF